MKKKQYFEISLTPDDVCKIFTDHFLSIEDVKVDDVIYIIGDEPSKVDFPYPKQVVKEIILKGKL